MVVFPIEFGEPLHSALKTAKTMRLPMLERNLLFILRR